MKDFRESLKVNIQLKEEEEPTEREIRRKYERFVLDREEQFIKFINYLNRYINQLRKEGIISHGLVYRARIKAANSALKNYGKKAVDDIFGIEFICETEEEILELQKQINLILLIHKEKKHKKENGYEATHCSYSMSENLIDELNNIFESQGQERKERESFPRIEVQYKTAQVDFNANFGLASHEKYKKVEVARLQQLFDSNCLTLGEYIPYMWVSNPYGDNMRELTKEEVLRKMYPSLKLQKKNEEIKEEKIGEEIEI